MNTTKEQKALKLALDFVEDVYLGEWRGPTERQEEVISAIKAALEAHKALAQPEPEQEPVAWIDSSGHPKHLSHVQGIREKQLYGELKPLYTHPPVPYVVEPRTAQPKLQTCNCRWDGEVQVQQCTLHESHVDAVHE